MKKYLFGLVLFLSIGLCGCGDLSDGKQIGEGTGIIENTTDRQEGSQNREAIAEDILPNVSDDMSDSDLATVGESWEGLKELMFGGLGNLGLGFLAYTVPDNDNTDYRLYFFKSENEEDRYLSFEEKSFKLSEASFVFPDVREGNVPMGKFKEIYFMDYTDVLKDGSCDVIVIALYEKDGNEYYDTRVYEEREKGFDVNVALSQELNEKYYNVENYPVEKIISMPGN